VLHDIGLTIDRSGGLAPAADTAAEHRSVAQAGNCVAVLDNSAAAEADNFPGAAIRNSAVAVIDSCAAQNNCAPVETGIEAVLQAGWVLVVGVAPDAAVATGWVPDGKDAVQDRCDDSARGTALPPRPASLCTRPAGAEIAPLLSFPVFPRSSFPYFVYSSTQSAFRLTDSRVHLPGPANHPASLSPSKHRGSDLRLADRPPLYQDPLLRLVPGGY
jgi:hypothetical protein